ncbi:MAG: glycosyltransferase family 4 protein [Bacteroidales bacterium]|nr:glycosyltransferase family 4 protein [Bacteroidales bacterium]
MRILVDCHCFDYVTSEGVNTHIRGLYSAMLRHAPEDWEFYFASKYPEKLTWAGYRQDVDSDYSNEVISSRVHFVKLSDGGKLQRLLFEYPKIIRRNHIDFAHFQYNAPPFKSLLGRRSTQGGRCALVVTLHDILFKDFPELFPKKYKFFKGLTFRFSAKRADHLLTVSEYSKKRISKHFGIGKHHIFVTPNAVLSDFYDIDEQKAREFTASKGVGKYLLCVSRFEPRKKQDLLLKTYLDMRLWEKGYDLVLIGRKTLAMPEFDRLLSGLSSEVRQHIKLLYNTPYQELKLWYKAASLFVYPAIAEGFGIPPIEAGAAGVPCICSNKTAMEDFSFFGENHIDCSDEALLQARIRTALGLEETTTSTGTGTDFDAEAIKAKILDVYNWDNVAKSLISHLTQL